MTSTPTSAEAKWYDAKTLRKRLSVSLRTIRAWDAGGKLPTPTKLGPKLKKWRVDEIEAWLEAGAPDRREWDRRNKRRAS